MLTALHTLIYSEDAAATRAFFRDTLKLKFVDAMDGWLIFALPPAELGIHPTEGGTPTGRHELYLMCDDIESMVADLKRKGVEFTKPVTDAGWGILTALKVPGAGELHLYQPRHKSPLKLKPPAKTRKAPKPNKPSKPARTSKPTKPAARKKKATKQAPPTRRSR